MTSMTMLTDLLLEQPLAGYVQHSFSGYCQQPPSSKRGRR
ncbi:MAG: hypothetical protein ACLRP7_06015 [Christensenellales bacterium]